MAVRKRDVITPPLKWHGGKQPLASWIIGLMPRHIHYVEPFAGGLAVLLARDPDDRRLWLHPHKGVSEVANDLDGRLVNFWRVLRDEWMFDRFRRKAHAAPMCRSLWEECVTHSYGDDEVNDAFAFFVCCRQSMSGRMSSFTPLTRTRLRRRINDNASAWLSAVEGLPAVHNRLRTVVIENLPATDVIAREDSPGTLFYLDPPYIPGTRSSPDVYRHEMPESSHRDLLDVITTLDGKVMVSGYPSRMYDEALRGWSRHTRRCANHAATGASKRVMTEVLWCNF